MTAPRPAFLVTPYPRLAAEHHVTDYTGTSGSGCVVIDLDEDGACHLQLFSEEHARALEAAAAKAAAMFAARGESE